MAIDFDDYRSVMLTLAEANYRDLCADCTKQRHTTAQWVLCRGYKPQDIAALWSYACRKGTRSSEGYFASSFAKPSTLAKRVSAARKWWLAQEAKQLEQQEASRPTAAPIYDIKRSRREA